MRGSPDYGLPDYSFFAVETPVSDVVAERQGFSRLDNRGRVFWFEDWRAGLSRMQTDYSHVATQVKHDYETGLGIGYHGRVILDPTVQDGYAKVYNSFMLPVSKRLGIEVSFNMTVNSCQLGIDLEHNYGGIVRRGANLIINGNGERIQILRDGGIETIFTPTNVSYMYNRFISIKLVVDFSEGTYERAMIGNTQYDLSGFGLSNGTNGLIGDTWIALEAYGITATYVEPVSIGYIIVSGDEP